MASLIQQNPGPLLERTPMMPRQLPLPTYPAKTKYLAQMWASAALGLIQIVLSGIFRTTLTPPALDALVIIEFALNTVGNVMRPEPMNTTDRLRAIAYDECVHDDDDVDTITWAADELDALAIQNNILRSYLSEDVLQRLAIENGWPHEIGNPLGKWCCDEHREAFANGTLYPTQRSQQ